MKQYFHSYYIVGSVIALLLAGVSTIYAAITRVTRQPISTTLCAIAENPRRFDRKLVMFKARFDMPGLEGTWLNDKGCDDVNIAAEILEKAKGGDQLRNAYQDGILGTSDKIITGTWVGAFRWQPGKSPKRILYVSEIRDIMVNQK